MRELKRSIARENMRKMGFAHINKKRMKTDANPTGKSFFAEHWREYVSLDDPKKGKKKRKGLFGRKKR